MGVAGGRAVVVALWMVTAACGQASTAQCFNDVDCVAATCCHAREAVHRSEAPDCSNTACTEDYQFCTTDDPNVRPYCDGRVCRMRQPPWCAVVP